MGYQYFTLLNGIRVIHKYVDNEVAHCGIMINAGSRDEKHKEHGIAHFIEHVIFKGTKKRNVFYVLSRLEDIGAEINAYTSKEETCIYASFINIYYERTIELFEDIIFNSTFPKKELEKEKNVVIDEINSFKDNPSEEIFDDFEEILFQGHPIGRNILGNPENIKKFNKDDIINFIQNNYHTDQMVICSVGKIEFKKLIKIIEKYFSYIPANIHQNQRLAFSKYKPINKIIEKQNHQTHCITGNIAYNFNDKRKTALVLLNNILGGPVLNSRLNLGIREKYGLSYDIESNYVPYSDTGVFNIYLATYNGFFNKSIDLVNKEMKKLREQKLGTLQLKKAKQQLIGQLAIYYESNLNEMLSVAKAYLLNNKVDTLKQINKKIESVSSEMLIEIANEIFNPNQLSMLVYKT